MNPETPQPRWNKLDPSASLLRHAEWLHKKAVDMFLADKTHAHILFLFTLNDGMVSVNPLPPDITNKQILDGVRRAAREHNLYAVISITEAWTYFPKSDRDHTIVQLMHNEMGVADLRDEDKVEVLMVRMESRDGDGLVWLNRIIRNGDDVSLGDSARHPLEKALKQDRFFDNGGR